MISGKDFCVNSKLWGDGYCDATFLDFGLDDGGDCVPPCFDTRLDGLKSVNPKKKCLRNLAHSIQYLTYLGGNGIDLPLGLSIDSTTDIINVLVRSRCFSLLNSY